MKAKFPKDGQLTINALLIRKNFINALRQKAKKKKTYLNVRTILFLSHSFWHVYRLSKCQIPTDFEDNGSSVYSVNPSKPINLPFLRWSFDGTLITDLAIIYYSITVLSVGTSLDLAENYWPDSWSLLCLQCTCYK